MTTREHPCGYIESVYGIVTPHGINVSVLKQASSIECVEC